MNSIVTALKARPAVASATTAIAVFAVYITAWPTAIDPAAYEPDEPPAMEGVLEPNDRLRGAVRIAEGAVDGPEDVEVGADGLIYAGTQDGRIVRIEPDTEAVDTFAQTGGRPLGMMFDDTGDLIVCDAYEGLLSIDESGDIEVLADEADGLPFGFTNDLDIADDGTIYFTDASHRFEQSEYLYDLLESRPHGRFMHYDPDGGDVEVLADALYFANGVALADDESFAVVNETYRYQIRRVWLDGERRGDVEVFADNLPGFPDNINRSSDGTFWLALYTVRNPMMDRLHPSPFAKKATSRLPKLLWPAPEPHGFVAEVDHTGQIIDTYQDPGGEVLSEVTSVKEFDDALYLGTLDNHWIGRLEL